MSDFKETNDIRYARYKDKIFHNYSVDRDGNIINLVNNTEIAVNTATCSLIDDKGNRQACHKSGLIKYTFELVDNNIDYIEKDKFVETDNERYIRYKDKIFKDYSITREGRIRNLRTNHILKSRFIHDSNYTYYAITRSVLVEYTFNSEALYEYVNKPIIVSFEESSYEKYPIYKNMVFDTYSVDLDGNFKDLKTNEYVEVYSESDIKKYVMLYYDYKYHKVYVNQCLKATFYINKVFEDNDNEHYMKYNGEVYHKYSINKAGDIFKLDTHHKLRPNKDGQVVIWSDTDHRRIVKVTTLIKHTFEV